MQVDDQVYFTAKYQRLLYQKGYENALGRWRVVETYKGHVKLQPVSDGRRKPLSMGLLTVQESPQILQL